MGSFAKSAQINLPFRPNICAAGDMDNDGDLDLVVPITGGDPIGQQNLVIFLYGNGDTLFFRTFGTTSEAMTYTDKPAKLSLKKGKVIVSGKLNIRTALENVFKKMQKTKTTKNLTLGIPQTTKEGQKNMDGSNLNNQWI